VVRSLWLALLLALAFPSFASDMSQVKSILLVARKDLPDPFFRDSVVLITPSGPQGASLGAGPQGASRGAAGGPPIGVIVNRPTKVPLSGVFPEVEGLRSRDEKLFFGGPVAREQLVVVFRATAPREGALEVLDGVFMTSNRDVFRELLARPNPVEGLKVFAGYAGWAPGQLEAEVARGDWHLAPADARVLFGTPPDKLWEELERRASATKTRFTPSSRAGPARGPVSP
jgi:putative transcriptional regulator